MHLLVTGGCGFLGSNIASEAIKKGYKVSIFDNLSRKGSEENLKWLKSIGDISFFQKDIREYGNISSVIKACLPDAVFHLAGQVAMTTSLEDPRKDFEINVVGTHNLLESLRQFSPETKTIYSSTNKVYGDLEGFTYTEQETRYHLEDLAEGFAEDITLDFRSPYGCSKGAADQYMLDYARNFGLKTMVFRHSSIFGGRQFSTFDQGWVGWFVEQALLQKKDQSSAPFTISGNGKQVRDVLFSSDLINCYFKGLANIDNCSGEAFNIGGGIQNSLSLLELFSFLEKELNVTLDYKEIELRSNDQKFFVANTAKAQNKFNWKPLIGKEEGLKEMINWVRSSV